MYCMNTYKPAIRDLVSVNQQGDLWHLGLDTSWFSIPGPALKMLVMALGTVTNKCPLFCLHTHISTRDLCLGVSIR